jgi:hypothetical protein
VEVAAELAVVDIVSNHSDTRKHQGSRLAAVAVPGHNVETEAGGHCY